MNRRSRIGTIFALDPLALADEQEEEEAEETKNNRGDNVQTSLHRLAVGVAAPDDEAAPIDAIAVNEAMREQLMAEALVSDRVWAMVGDVDIQVCLDHTKAGAFLLKYCSNLFRHPHQRMFHIDMEKLQLHWSSPKKPPERTTIRFVDVVRVAAGIDSDFWRNKTAREKALGVELILSTTNKRFHFVCPSSREWQFWFLSLLYAHHKATSTRAHPQDLVNDSLIRKQWDAAVEKDTRGGGHEVITLNKLVTVLNNMNIAADFRYAKQLFEAFDHDNSNALEYPEFRQLLQKVMIHQDFTEYFELYKTAKRSMNQEGFKNFLLDSQQTASSIADEIVRDVFEQLQSPFKDEATNELTEFGFNAILASEMNSIFTPLKRQVYQDMTQPLTSYWIASSHNTYLTSDQIVGRSAVGQYIDVLLRGCRCVELDCWDGPDGEPIIYHGHTLTSKLLFKDVIRACADYGFKASPYPVILSLEMHCSDAQKIRVAEILKEELKEKLVMADSNNDNENVPRFCPSPDELKFKFLAKARPVNPSVGELELEGNEEDIELEEREIEAEMLLDFPEDYCINIDLSPPMLPAVLVDQTVDRHTITKMNKDQIQLYNSTIALPGRELKSFEDSKRHVMHVCSLNENKFDKVFKKDSKAICKFLQKHFLRIYPAGTRLMSSNYNPMPCWLSGAQMVALNYQAMGLARLMYMGRFLENGKSGYVLKPQILMNPNFDPLNPDLHLLKQAREVPIEVAIEVLGGQQLPKPFAYKHTTTTSDPYRNKDPCCPYVVIVGQGIAGEAATHRTNVVSNNGLNPKWKNQTFVFDFLIPSIGIVVFEVRHYDPVSTEFLAGCAIPVTMIRPGIRWIPLFDGKVREIRWSGLVAHVTIRPSRKYQTLATPLSDVLVSSADGANLAWGSPKTKLKRTAFPSAAAVHKIDS